MQMTKEAKAYQKSAWIIRLVFLLAGLMRLEEMGLARDLMKRILKRG